MVQLIRQSLIHRGDQIHKQRYVASWIDLVSCCGVFNQPSDYQIPHLVCVETSQFNREVLAQRHILLAEPLFVVIVRLCVQCHFRQSY